RSVPVSQRRRDPTQVEDAIHALELDVLTPLDVHGQAEVEPVQLVRTLVVEQVLITVRHPLVAVRGAVLVPAAVPEIVDTWLAPALRDAVVPALVGDTLSRLPVLPPLDEVAPERVDVADARHVPV